jgi:hypothetical protein
MINLFQLAHEKAELHQMGVKQYLAEMRPHFLHELSHRQLFVPNKTQGVELIKPSDVTLVSAKQIFFDGRKSVAQHYLNKGKPLQHPHLPCVAVKRSAVHYDYFPVEICFYVSPN